MDSFSRAVRALSASVRAPGAHARRVRRRRLGATLALGLVCGLGFGLPSVYAAPPPVDLPGLVSTVPVTYTPNVVRGSFPEDLTTQVWGYVPLNGVMYACGDFAQVKSSDGTVTYDRHNVFAFDPFTGDVSDFAPDVDGPVNTCTAGPDGQSLFLGGDFDTINGQPVQNVAEIDALSGQVVTTFAASANGPVTDLMVLGDRLLISGSFSSVGGQTQAALATVNLETGAFDPYLGLQIEGRVADNSGPTRVYRFALNPEQTSGVAIGNFTTVDGVAHSGAFRFSLRGALPALITWDNPMFHAICGPTQNMPVWSRDVQFSPNGKFFVIDGTGGRGGGLCDTTSRWESKSRGADVAPTWVNVTCVDTLHSVAVTNTVVYVQGHQKCVMGKKGDQVPRYGIAALSADTGFALSWRSDQSRLVGGKFLMITTGATQPGFPTGLWSGCDCGPEGGVIFRPIP